MNDVQRRRTPRLRTRLQVQVIGVDDEPRASTGDISMGGLFMDTDREIGALGSVQRLRLANVDGSGKLTLLARVARVVATDDIWRGRIVSGVAFQFMFEERSQPGLPPVPVPIERSKALADLVRKLASQGAEQESRLDHIWQGTVETTQAKRSATVQGVSLLGTVLETDFPVPLGELIRVDIPGPSPEQRIPLFGRVIASEPTTTEHGTRYRTQVSFEASPPTAAPSNDVAGPSRATFGSGGSIQEALGALVSSPTLPSEPAPPDQRPRHLAGDLARISLPSVLTVCEIERATGVLKLQNGEDQVRCYFREGRIIDLECSGDAMFADIAEALTPVISWRSGSFDFSFEAVERADAVQMSTHALLLSLTHAVDQARRDRGSIADVPWRSVS